MRAAPAHSRSTERPVMSLASLSPEAQLLLLTAGGERNDRAIRALLAGPLDWAKLTWLSEQERATPVLWRRLSAIASLPEEAQPLHRDVDGVRVPHVASRVAAALRARCAGGGGDRARAPQGRGARAHGVRIVRRASDVGCRSARAARRCDARARGAARVGWAEGVESSPEFYEGHHHLQPLVDAQGTGTSVELHTSLFFEGHPFALTSDDIRRRAEQGGGARANGAGAECARSAAASVPALRVVAHDGDGRVARLS